MKKTGWLVPVFIGTLALIGCEDPSHEGLLKENQATISELESAKKDAEDKVTKLKSKYVNPMQFDAKNIAGIAVVKKSSTARFAEESDSGVDLVVIKENGDAEPAIAFGTEENAELTEAVATDENNVEPEYVYVYVTEHQEAKVMKTVQCTYELNDKEAGGYYIVFDGKSTFTYSDGTKKETGSLIYVTPEGDERDIFVAAGVDASAKINYYGVAWGGGELISFDENGNAFFKAITPNGEKLYRYQPIANKLDDLTPAGIAGLEDFSFAVSLDGKYLLITYETKTSRGVKGVKVADKSVYDVFTTDIPKDDCAIVQAVYMDKNHSFYFATSSFGKTNDDEINFIHRWNYETKKLDSVKYTPESKYYNGDLSWPQDPAEGAGSLIITEEGVFVMQPMDWVENAYTGSRLIKVIDANGEYIKVEIPSSLKDKKFAPPRYNLNVEVDGEKPETWYRPAFLSNGKGIAVVGSKQDTIYYYAGNQLKDLLAFDTDILSDIKMGLSDKSIIFDAKRKGTTFTKSVNLENGEVTTLSINGTVLNILAVKGATIKEGDASGVNLQLSIKISEQSDLKVENKTEGSKLILEAAEGYSDYTWSCNGYVLETEKRTLTKEGVDKWEKGFYPIYVTAKKDGFIYSSFIEVEVK